MASGRFLSTSIADDYRLNELSMMGELLYLKTIPHLDRDGMISGKPGYLWGKVCPLREELIGLMQGIIDEWVLSGLAIRTLTDIGPVLFFPGFLKNNNLPHYNRERPSRFPPPPGFIRTDKGLVAESTNSTDEIQELLQDEVQDEIMDSSMDKLQDFDLQEQEQEEDQVKEQDQELQEDDEDAHARDAIHQTWFDVYDAEMPKDVEAAIAKELKDCPEENILHAIRVSVNAKERTFKYLKKCALNYMPPAPTANGNVYSMDVPGIVPLPAAPIPAPIPEPPPPPMAHDDPWAICVAELIPAFASTSAGRWITGSRLEPNGELAGVPFYRVVLTASGADALWMTQQAEPAIRKKLASVLGKRIQLEIVAEREAVTA